MTSDDGLDELAVKEYDGGSVTVKDDFDNHTIYVQAEGDVEFVTEFAYGDGIPHPALDDARGHASRDAKIFADGAVRALREANGFPESGDDV